MTETNSPIRPPKHRSPSYPAYDLEATLDRAKQLHEMAGTHRANVATVIREWGYTSKSSKGLLMLAALKKFALAEDQGKGDARTLMLTPLGRELVYYDSDRTSEDWRSRARTAAMTPTIHRELWGRYEGHLPTDSVMKDYMVLEGRFSESAAEEVLSEFRRTLAFAGIEDGDSLNIVRDTEGEPSSERGEDMTATATPPAQQEATKPTPPRPTAAAPTATPSPATQKSSTGPLPVNVNLSDGGWAILQVSNLLSEAQWDQLMAVLNAMKPGLTS